MTCTRTWVGTIDATTRAPRWDAADGSKIVVTRRSKDAWHVLVCEGDSPYPIIDEVFWARGDALKTARGWLKTLTKYRD